MGVMLSVLAIALFVAAAACDLAERRIPNRLVAALALVGLTRIAWALVTAEDGGLGAAADPVADIIAALAIFGVGAVVFHLNLVGGGDVKLLAAGALWLGSGTVWPFLFVTAVAGGALSVLYLAAAAFAGLPRAERPALPYGVAIAAGGILATVAAV